MEQDPRLNINNAVLEPSHHFQLGSKLESDDSPTNTNPVAILHQHQDAMDGPSKDVQATESGFVRNGSLVSSAADMKSIEIPLHRDKEAALTLNTNGDRKISERSSSDKDAQNETLVVIKRENGVDNESESQILTNGTKEESYLDLNLAQRAVTIDPKLLGLGPEFADGSCLPSGPIPLGPLTFDNQVQQEKSGESDGQLRRCESCKNVFGQTMDFVLHHCSAMQHNVGEAAHDAYQESNTGIDPGCMSGFPNTINPDMQIFECTKCRLLFNAIAELKDHKCLGYLNEPEREERKRRRMVRVSGEKERAAAHKAKIKLHKIVSALVENKAPLKMKIKLSKHSSSESSVLKKSRKLKKYSLDKEKCINRKSGPNTVKEYIIRNKKETVMDVMVPVKRKRGRPPKIRPPVVLEDVVKQESIASNVLDRAVVRSLPKIVNRVQTGHIKVEPEDETSPVAPQENKEMEDHQSETFLGVADDVGDDDDDEGKDETYVPTADDLAKGADAMSSCDKMKPLKKRRPRGPNKQKVQKPQDPNKEVKKKRKTDPADLICRFCGKKCRKPYELRVHERFHTNERPFKCTMSNCKKTYVSNSLLNKHIREAHVGANLRCKECGLSFDSKEQLKAHCEQYNHNIQWPYACDKCDKSYPKRKMLENHVLTHQGIKPFPCGVCGVGFNTRVSLLQHSHTHTGDRPHACEQCGSRFLTRHLLSSHKMNHTGERPHLCDVCGKGFKLAAQLRHHADVHRKEKPYMCDHCGKKFKWRYNMLNHAKTHTNKDLPKPLRYFCSVCGKGYYHKSGLEYHERTHTGERPYMCRRCGKKFRHNAHLQKHLNRVHHLTMDLKPLAEEDMPERKKSTRTAPGTRPFPCELCSKEFRQRAGLEKHMRIFHRLTLAGEPIATELPVLDQMEPQMNTSQLGQYLEGREIATTLGVSIEQEESPVKLHTMENAAHQSTHTIIEAYQTSATSRTTQAHQPFVLDAMATNTLLAPTTRPSDSRSSFVYPNEYLSSINMPAGLVNVPSGFLTSQYNVRTILSEEEAASLP